MAVFTREALLGASDIVEREVELPSIGGSVRVRSLPAAYLNQAQSEALEIRTDDRGGQSAHVSSDKLEALQMLHGLVEPKLNSIEDAQTLSQQLGQAWHEIIRVINEISGINKEEVEKTSVAFPSSGQSETGTNGGNGTTAGSGGPDLPARAGVGVEDAGRGDV